MPKIEKVDFRSITRDADKCLTKVYIYMGHKWEGHEAMQEWLTFGSCYLRNEDSLCWLAAYMNYGITDFEHDSAYALRLPLIGLKFLRVFNHATHLEAYVDPDNASEFCVPSPGYNPTMLKEAYECPDCKEHHMIVPEGYYVPPFNEELYNIVRGKKLDICITIARE